MLKKKSTPVFWQLQKGYKWGVNATWLREKRFEPMTAADAPQRSGTMDAW